MSWPVTPARIQHRVESFVKGRYPFSAWRDWEKASTWAIAAGLEPDLSRARQQLADEITGDQHSLVLGSAFRVGIVSTDQIEQLVGLKQGRASLIPKLRFGQPRPICEYVFGTWESALDNSPHLQLVRVCREGKAWPLAAGLMVGGSTPLVMMQTTGLFESGDALRNIVFDPRIPVIAIIGARNWLDPDSKDTAKRFARPILEAWGIQYQVVDGSNDQPKLADFFRDCQQNNEPRIIVLAE